MIPTRDINEMEISSPKNFSRSFLRELSQTKSIEIESHFGIISFSQFRLLELMIWKTRSKNGALWLLLEPSEKKKKGGPNDAAVWMFHVQKILEHSSSCATLETFLYTHRKDFQVFWNPSPFPT